MKLKTLKPRLLAAAPARLSTLATATNTVQRKRGSAGVKDRASIRQRDQGLCQECLREGWPRPGHVVDHIVPLWMGGSDHDSNKELLCDPCHDAKTAREAGERARGSDTFECASAPPAPS